MTTSIQSLARLTSSTLSPLCRSRSEEIDENHSLYLCRIGDYLVLGVIAGIALETPTRGPELEVTDGSVIELTISADYGETASPSLSALLSGEQSLPHFSVLNTIHRATNDPQIVGLKLVVQTLITGFAQLQELNEGFAHFTRLAMVFIALSKPRHWAAAP